MVTGLPRNCCHLSHVWERSGSQAQERADVLLSAEEASRMTDQHLTKSFPKFRSI